MKFPDITPLSEIAEALYLSSYHAITEEKLKRCGITHVMNVTQEHECVSFDGLPDLTHTRILIRDMEEANMLKHLDACVDKINEVAAAGGRTLVHCVMGISRSATVCIAYMMKYRRMTLRVAFEHVKARRSVIYPNIGFWAQMVEYEEHLYGTTTVEMLPYSIGFIPSIMKEHNLFTERWAMRQSNVVGYVQILCALAAIDIVSLIFWSVLE